MGAASFGYEGCVQLLLEAQANVNDTEVSLEPSPKPLPRGSPLAFSHLPLFS